MKEENKLALVVAYYLSKFDAHAYSALELGATIETHKKIGRMLNVNPNTIKNMRDEFDLYTITLEKVGTKEKSLKVEKV